MPRSGALGLGTASQEFSTENSCSGVQFPIRADTKTASIRIDAVFVSVGLLGIEPSLYAPEAHVLPVYDSPSFPAKATGYERELLIVFLLRRRVFNV